MEKKRMPEQHDATNVDLDAPLIAVSSDTHMGPRLAEDLRSYCPRKYIDEYDEFVRAYEPLSDPVGVLRDYVDDQTHVEQVAALIRQNATPGHHDVHARLRDMDRDGVAAEVIYHGSQNGQCFPFIDPSGGTFNAVFFNFLGSPHELELVAVGQRMYNRWLADQCSVEPERHVGLAHLPAWDLDAALAELDWATKAGLRGVNFPAPKTGVKPYDDPAWEPLWAMCEERGVVLSTHDGAASDGVGVVGPHTSVIVHMEELPPKMLPRLIFGGIFERHPALKIVLAEIQQPLDKCWPPLIQRYDEIWHARRHQLGAQVPRPPSDYMRENFFFGHSRLLYFPEQVELAIQGGYAQNVLWGSDYPHTEGSYRGTEDDQAETSTVRGMRHAFASAPPELAKGMLGEYAVDVYGLDREQLQAVAKRIDAITLRRLGTPLDVVPEDWTRMAAGLRL